MGIRINSSIEQQIVTGYNQGVGCTKLSRQYQVGESTVLRVLKRNNVVFRGASEARRTYVVNEHYFDSIDSEDKAYFLGLLYADGNNYTKKFHAVHLALQEEDGYLVRTFTNLLYGRHKEPHLRVLVNPKHANQVRIRIYNKRLSEQLYRLGCVDRKSLVLTFPTFLDQQLLPHFVRGYFDGDGSIIKVSDERYFIDIISSKEFCLGLQKILCSLSIISTYSECNNSRNGHLLLQRKAEVRRFLEWIYTDSTPAYRMKRKYEAALLFLQVYEHGRAMWTEKESTTLVNNIELPTRKLKLLIPNRSNSAIEHQKAKIKQRSKKE